MCLNETCSRVRVGKQFCDMFPITKRLIQGTAWLSLFLDNIRRVQAKQDGLKLWSTHQLMVYTDDVNIMGESEHIIEKRPEALLVASKELDQNAGRIQYVKVDEISFEMWTSSDMWGQPKQINNLLRKKLRGGGSQRMLSIIRRRILCLQNSY